MVAQVAEADDQAPESKSKRSKKPKKPKKPKTDAELNTRPARDGENARGKRRLEDGSSDPGDARQCLFAWERLRRRADLSLYRFEEGETGEFRDDGHQDRE